MEDVAESGVLAQWGRDVPEFSSQYGSETSIAYTVSNIAGQSTIYPSYGDFTQAAVLVSAVCFAFRSALENVNTPPSQPRQEWSRLHTVVSHVSALY